MRYRRAWQAGGTFFFTLTLADRDSGLLVSGIDSLRRAFRTVQQRHPFHVDAIVILPDHLHAIWTLPSGDCDFSVRWALIKSAFSRSLPRIETITASRAGKGERGIWQRRFWEHRVRDEPDFRRHVDYIHWNPVKHGHVTRVSEWPYSSFHHYVEAGDLAEDWGVASEGGSGAFGEPG